jgi:pimeloyl-ACP methyl ester carboxylesterase
MENHELYVDVAENIKCCVIQRYKDTTESKKALLLLHGVADGHIVWDLQIKDYSVMDYLAERNFVVYAPDLRGFGKSTITSGIDVRAETCADDTKKVVDFVKRQLRVAKIHLVGASFGAMIVATYAAKYSQDVEKLALISPLYRDLSHTFKDMVRSTLDLINKGTGYSPNPTQPGALGGGLYSADGEVVNYYSRLKLYCPNNPTGPFLDMVQGGDNNLPTDRYIPLITAPTLLIAAGNDEIAPAENSKLLYQDLRMQDKKLVSIPGVSHKMTLERKGHTAIMEELREWFED